MPMALNEEDFAGQQGTQFRARLDQLEGNLNLEEVKTYQAGADEESGMARFSVYFSGPPERFLPQGFYQMSHDVMGEFELFLVPISGDEKGFRYEAVFNYYK